MKKQNFSLPKLHIGNMTGYAESFTNSMKCYEKGTKLMQEAALLYGDSQINLANAEITLYKDQYEKLEQEYLSLPMNIDVADSVLLLNYESKVHQQYEEMAKQNITISNYTFQITQLQNLLNAKQTEIAKTLLSNTPADASDQ